MDVFHKPNYEAQFNFWSQQGAQTNIEQIMDFDPFLGRMVESTTPQ